MPVTLLTISDWSPCAICDRTHIIHFLTDSKIGRRGHSVVEKWATNAFLQKKVHVSRSFALHQPRMTKWPTYAIWIDHHFMTPIIIACRGASGCNPTQAGAWSGQPTVGVRPPAQVLAAQVIVTLLLLFIHINFQIFVFTLHLLSPIYPRWTRGKVLFCH